MSNLTDFIGGASVPINGALALNETDAMVTTSSGSVMLKSGIVDTAIASYPDAKTSLEFSTVTFFNSFLLGNGESDVGGMDVDDDYIYMVGNTLDKLYIFDKVDALTGVSTLVASMAISDTVPEGVAVDNEYLYVTGSTNDNIVVYDRIDALASTVTVVRTFSLAVAENSPTDIAVDDSYVYFLGAGNGDITIYNKIELLAGVSVVKATVDISGSDSNMRALAVTHDYVCCSGNVSNTTYVLDKPALLSGIKVVVDSFAAPSSAKEGLAFDNLYLWTCLGTTGYAHTANYVVGLPVAKIDTVTNLPTYTRIK